MCVYFSLFAHCSVFFLNMATFDFNQSIDRPSVEGLEVCRKKYLFLIAQHYEILISRTQRKAGIKACLMSALLDRGVFPAIEAVPTEAAESVIDAAGSSPSRVPVGDCGWRGGRSTLFNA